MKCWPSFAALVALLEGHFKLSSGKHSGHYLQCARVLMNPARAARLAEAVVAGIPANVRERVEAVVSPAMGGIIIGHEVGRALGKDAIFSRAARRRCSTCAAALRLRAAQRC